MKKLLFIFLFFSIFLCQADCDTFFMSVSENEFNDPNHPARDDICKPFFHLARAVKALGYKVKNIKNFDPACCAGCFFLNPIQLDTLRALDIPPEKCILSVWEPPLISPAFYRDFSPYPILHLADDMVDNKTSFKFFYPQPSLEIENDIPSFEDKKLCTMINSNKLVNGQGELYSARRSVISFFERKLRKKPRKKPKWEKRNFEFYGVGGWPKLFKTFKGSVAHKRPVIKKYRFCICYENCCNVRGYITEKIFDCLVSGCIPIYWGPENVTDYISADCFIDRRKFTNNEELYTFMKSMPKEEYDHYIENIKRYLKTEKAFLFSTQYFVDTILTHLFPGYDKKLIFSSEEVEMLKKAQDYYLSLSSRHNNE